MFSFKAAAQTTQLPPWKVGYLDIHQIATGKGNAAFIRMPDSTTMIIDAGDLGTRVGINATVMPALPNDSKLPGEWIADYITHFSPAPLNSTIDYALLTHFHNDHMGGVSAKAIRLANRDYMLSGITQVAELLKINKIVDRGYPNYDYPSKAAVVATTVDFNNYLKFIAYQEQGGNIQFERFQPGSTSQFNLIKAATKYPSFSIQNIYSSGELWTGKGHQVKSLFPAIETLSPAEYPNENMLSNVIKLSYGKFDYYSGGDVTGIISSEKPLWRDVESALAKVTGKVEVALLNHHGYSDAMNSTFVKALQAQAFVIPVWDYYHPQPETLKRLIAPESNDKRPEIYATGLVPENELRLGANASTIFPYGHVVTRVYPGGKTFQIFVLDAHSGNYEVIYKSAIKKAK